MNHSISDTSRRRFLGVATKTATLALLVPQVIHPFHIMRQGRKPKSKIAGVQVGVITYSYRSMPDQSAEAVLKYVVDSGINAIELMGGPAEEYAGIPPSHLDKASLQRARKFSRSKNLTVDQQKEWNEMKAAMRAHADEVASWRTGLSMSRYERLRKLYKKAGVKIYGFKPSALGKNNSDGEIDYACRAAKALGASHLTVEIPRDSQHTARLARIASKHKVYIAYHGHLQQTPTIWDVALSQSTYNAMNPDFGHYVAAGHRDSIRLLQDKHARIKSLHLKDRKNKENGQDNMPWGQGDTPIGEILQHIRINKYPIPCSIELEYPIPDGSDAVAEVSRCLDHCRTLLT